MGPKRVEQFNQLGIKTIYDLFFHFPFRYEDIQIRDIRTVLDQEKITLRGTVVSPPVVNYFGGKKSRLSFRLAVSQTEVIQVMFFNQPYLKNQIELGQEKIVYGKWQSNKQSLLGMKLMKLETLDENFAGVYPTVSGLKQTTITKVMKQAFEEFHNLIPELVPAYLNEKYRMMELPAALYAMHFPQTDIEKKQARRKIIFLEFFLFQWRLLRSSQEDKNKLGVRVFYEVDELKEIIKTLPYELTKAQKQAVNDICADLMSTIPMKRMLQGDVGSGKTLVAFLGMIATVLAGYQTILMVPTEILAKQHCASFNRLFEQVGLHTECLVSNIKTAEKNEIIDGLKTGRIKIVIGTHALIQENVQFKQLGLVVIDEQHRFGVGQRQTLLEKSKIPVNLLQMTATPIPRSLAMTVYGEMAVSTIDELPGGRKPIKTTRVDEQDIETVYQQMEIELNKGHQVYYVLPLIDASESLQSINNVLEIADNLTGQFPKVQVGVLHGQLDKNEQEFVMDSFKRNEVQILVATTMVEVGVDVPNATVIVIQSAERFGLAQLHQLRGRVGRSDLPSHCFLIGKPTTEQGNARLDIMVDSQDGFLISQEDLKIRGMGDLLGRNQSGLPQFHFANIIEDANILSVARQEAKLLVKQPLLIDEKEKMLLNEWSSHQQMEI